MAKRNAKINVKDIFRGLQDQMEAKLTFNRTIVRHPSAKGSATELEWIHMLTTYLPKRYCATKAFVIDSRGDISDEIDIVIYDRQYSPFILQQNGVTFLPAECVYAILEVKQDLSKATLEYARRKAQSVRKLKRTSVPIPHAGGEYPAKTPAGILAGIVALGGVLSRAEQRTLVNTARDRVLNFGCSLKGRTHFRLTDMHPWKTNRRPYTLEHSVDDNSLVNFFLNLIGELHRVGTVVAMDLKAYQR